MCMRKDTVFFLLPHVFTYFLQFPCRPYPSRYGFIIGYSSSFT